MVNPVARVGTYAEAIALALREEMERDERVVLMGVSQRDPRGGAFGATRGVSTAVGNERVLELPAAELGYTGAAVGAAMAGLRPVVEWPSADLAATALEPVVHQAARMRYLSGGAVSVPVVFRAPFGAFGAGGAHGSHAPEGWFSSVPGLKVVLPSNPRDARGLLKSAIRDDDPVLVFEHRQLYESWGEIPEEEEPIPLGAAEVRRPGSDVSIISYSYAVTKAMEAAALLAEEKIEAEVLDLRTSLPLDEAAILATVARTGRLVIVQEAHAPCSVASEVAALVAEKGLYSLDAPIRRVTAGWAPLPFSPALEQALLPQTAQIVAAVREVLAADGAVEESAQGG